MRQVFHSGVKKVIITASSQTATYHISRHSKVETFRYLPSQGNSMRSWQLSL